MGGKRSRSSAVAAGVAGILLLSTAPAGADLSTSPLGPGAQGRRVRDLQVRVAGWYPQSKRRVHFVLDGEYGAQTIAAVKVLQRRYGLPADGVAGPATWRVLRRLEDANKSTSHFNWGEFDQNFNASCSARANAYAGTFGGGMVSARRAKRNVRRLMWRLEVVRTRGGHKPIGINSAFRSVPYNDCIGGARASQHMYGTAADNRMSRVTNKRERRLAKRSEFHGIGCYSSSTHNHLDVRMDNRDLPSARFWWWPERDSKGRELDAQGRPCWGESARKGKVPATTTAAVLQAVREGRMRAGSLLPSVAEVEAFARAGEPPSLEGRD
jgi:zinc D-Ala-D-Ala carboxypeptidase